MDYYSTLYRPRSDERLSCLVRWHIADNLLIKWSPVKDKSRSGKSASKYRSIDVLLTMHWATPSIITRITVDGSGTGRGTKKNWKTAHRTYAHIVQSLQWHHWHVPIYACRCVVTRVGRSIESGGMLWLRIKLETDSMKVFVIDWSIQDYTISETKLIKVRQTISIMAWNSYGSYTNSGEHQRSNKRAAAVGTKHR